MSPHFLSLIWWCFTAPWTISSLVSMLVSGVGERLGSELTILLVITWSSSGLGSVSVMDGAAVLISISSSSHMLSSPYRGVGWVTCETMCMVITLVLNKLEQFYPLIKFYSNQSFTQYWIFIGSKVIITALTGVAVSAWESIYIYRWELYEQILGFIRLLYAWHFKVDPVSKMYETFYEQAKSMWIDTFHFLIIFVPHN